MAEIEEPDQDQEDEPAPLKGEEALELAREGPDAWNAWAEENPGRVVNFSGVDFTTEENEDIPFEGFTFPGNVNFFGARFKFASFEGTIFKGEVQFNSSTFEQYSRFDEATFIGEARFIEATFEGIVLFIGVTFEKGVNFGGASFKSVAGFKNAKFKYSASFNGVTFVGAVDFNLRARLEKS